MTTTPSDATTESRGNQRMNGHCTVVNRHGEPECNCKERETSYKMVLKKDAFDMVYFSLPVKVI